MTEKMKIIDFLRENQLDAIFVQKDENCRYLSKFTGSDSYLLLTKEELYLLTDSRQEKKLPIIQWWIIKVIWQK